MSGSTWSSVFETVPLVKGAVTLAAFCAGMYFLYRVRQLTIDLRILKTVTSETQAKALESVRDRFSIDPKDLREEDRLPYVRIQLRHLAAKDTRRAAFLLALAALATLWFVLDQDLDQQTAALTMPRESMPTSSDSATQAPSANDGAPVAITPVNDTFERDHAEWVRQAEEIRHDNAKLQADYETAVKRWERENQEEDTRHAQASAQYAKAVNERKLLVAHRDKGARGDNTGPNTPYNTRLDVPRGTTLQFEIEPANAIVRMKRDRPHGEDPTTFDDLRNGSIVRTTWDPGCENCNFYFKQDSVPHATITVWRDGKPTPPTRRTITHPVPPTLKPVPKEPERLVASTINVG